MRRYTYILFKSKHKKYKYYHNECLTCVITEINIVFPFTKYTIYRTILMALNKHISPVNFGPYFKFPVSMSIHEFMNIDDVWGP